MSPALMALLNDLRQHSAFPELMAALPKPVVRRFTPAQAPNLDAAQARWIYESGQMAKYVEIVSLLTGSSVPLTTEEG